METAHTHVGRRVLRVATRRSALAMEQARLVVERLHANAGITCDIIPITTQGDELSDRSLIAIGGDGVFVKELMNALLDQRADLAVHSFKDVPTDLPRAVAAGVVLEREDARDVLISKNNRWTSIDLLPVAAVVGTSSLRRCAQLHAVRPDLAIVPLRGNVDSRVRKVLDGECDAAVLARAGLLRIGLLEAVGGGTPLECDVMVPAVGQGALYVQFRQQDREAAQLLAPLNHEPTALATLMERAFLKKMGGGCVAPIGAHVAIESGKWRFWAAVVSLDGATALRRTADGPADDAAKAVAAVETIASEMLAAGGREIIATSSKRISDAT